MAGSEWYLLGRVQEGDAPLLELVPLQLCSAQPDKRFGFHRLARNLCHPIDIPSPPQRFSAIKQATPPPPSYPPLLRPNRQPQTATTFNRHKTSGFAGLFRDGAP